MIDLRPDHLELVKGILARQVPGYEVRVFGSRVTGKAKPHSDLDLVVMTASPLPPLRLADLKDAFSDSDLPFRVDVLDWQTLSVEFRAFIEQRYGVVQAAKPNSAKPEGRGTADEWVAE